MNRFILMIPIIIVLFFCEEAMSDWILARVTYLDLNNGTLRCDWKWLGRRFTFAGSMEETKYSELRTQLGFPKRPARWIKVGMSSRGIFSRCYYNIHNGKIWILERELETEYRIVSAEPSTHWTPAVQRDTMSKFQALAEKEDYKQMEKLIEAMIDYCQPNLADLRAPQS